MTMTEEEAKQKWCHRFSHDDGAQARMRSGDFAYACIASACMAWRGGETDEFRAKAEAEYRRSGVRLTPNGRDLEGYCGLAGSPS